MSGRGGGGFGTEAQRLVTSVATNANDHSSPRENIGTAFCHQLIVVDRTYLF